MIMIMTSDVMTNVADAYQKGVKYERQNLLFIKKPMNIKLLKI